MVFGDFVQIQWAEKESEPPNVANPGEEEDKPVLEIVLEV
jgi:hypothetical protein